MATRGRPSLVKDWFFTVTMRPEHYRLTKQQQYYEGRHAIQVAIRDVLNSYPRFKLTEYFFVPEFTKAGNIHFHGIIFANQMTMYRIWEELKSSLGHTMYKPHGKKWFTYIYKDTTSTSRKLSLKVDEMRFTFNELVRDCEQAERIRYEDIKQNDEDAADIEVVERKVESDNDEYDPTLEITEEEEALDFIDDTPPSSPLERPKGAKTAARAKTSARTNGVDE